jgi:hypothetical protein
MPPLSMSEEDYKASIYQRYACIDEKSGRVEEIGGWKGAGCLDWPDWQKNKPQPMSKTDYYAFVQDTFESLLALIKRKNADYTAGADDAFANFRRAEPIVPMLEATWVRWGDKIQRVDAYFRNGKLEVANEGLEDALLDVIGYSMIMLGELKEKSNAK